MVGRLHSAWRAVELGFEIEPRRRTVGEPAPLADRRASPTRCASCSRSGPTRSPSTSPPPATTATGPAASPPAPPAASKRHTGADELLPGWRAELEAVGWPVERLTADLDRRWLSTLSGCRSPLTDRRDRRSSPPTCSTSMGGCWRGTRCSPAPTSSPNWRPASTGGTRPSSTGSSTTCSTSRAVVPLIGIAGAREQTYTTVEVLAAEQTIAHTVDAPGRPARPRRRRRRASRRPIAAKERRLGHPLTAGQRAVVEHVCRRAGRCRSSSASPAPGKTTALDAAVQRARGRRLPGARHLDQRPGRPHPRHRGRHRVADVGVAAVAPRPPRHASTPATVVIVDEAAMADDADLARLVARRRTRPSAARAGR